MRPKGLNYYQTPRWCYGSWFMDCIWNSKFPIPFPKLRLVEGTGWPHRVKEGSLDHLPRGEKRREHIPLFPSLPN